MTDQSHLDSKYFVDGRVYNCPFCNRRHVAYHVYDYVSFDWSDQKVCTAFFVRCESCGKKSMHMSFDPPSVSHAGSYGSGGNIYRFRAEDGVDLGDVLDASFFYSVPTSFFVLDERVPRSLRELLTEAEGSLKSNYLTGASACARKIVYELGVLSAATGDNYEDRIKSLKEIHPEVDPAFFDTLLTIQQLTSTKVHENSYDGWESKHLRVILASLAEVLHEIYVVPALRADRRKEILALKERLSPKSKLVPGAEG
jgi:hypothetical protein